LPDSKVRTPTVYSFTFTSMVLNNKRDHGHFFA
jgi:hypothetical protein